jgi:protein farnesyltransferase/geranylgeranyltransferase type-1 subunit alpha
MGKYSQDPIWADIEPIPLNEAPDALAAIAFADDYLEATSYLRAVMAKQELSERVLALTGDIIALNPSHYTVWFVDYLL